MLTVNIPENLTSRINEFARLVCQTPEEYLIELIEERIEHDSAYNETAYLAKSETNRKRLDKAVRDIRAGKYEARGLINWHVLKFHFSTPDRDALKSSRDKKEKNYEIIY